MLDNDGPYYRTCKLKVVATTAGKEEGSEVVEKEVVQDKVVVGLEVKVEEMVEEKEVVGMVVVVGLEEG